MAEAASGKIDHARIERAWRSLALHSGLGLQLLEASGAEHEENTPATDVPLLRAIPARLALAEDAVRQNGVLLEKAAALSGERADAQDGPEHSAVTQALRDLPIVVDALRRLAADWGAVGKSFRDEVYGPIIEATIAAADDAVTAGDVAKRADFRVLVPNAGLGRLAWELARNGVTVQGAELEYVLLFLANFVLNGVATPGEASHTTLFPYALRLADIAEGRMEGVDIPDVDPAVLGADANFSMCAGEFLELYQGEEEWDCVVTCMFIEQAHNVVAYVRRIANILKVGGVWVNHGSLDFRYADNLDEPSIEVTEEELFNIIPRLGLRLVKKESQRISRPDVDDALVREQYESLFFIAVRV